jgi:hypothetical protein
MDDNLQTIHVRNKQAVVEGVTFLISVSSYLIHTMKDKFFIQHSIIIYHPTSVCGFFGIFPACAKILLFLRRGRITFEPRLSLSEWHHIALLQNSQDCCNWLVMPLHRIDHVLAIELRFGL